MFLTDAPSPLLLGIFEQIYVSLVYVSLGDIHKVVQQPQ